MNRCAIALLLLAATPCQADDQSFSTTTDTLPYCMQLVRQVAERHSPLLDVQRLLNEGREMCEQGEVRGGIRRLRRALVVLRHRTGAKEGS